jgi:hypothetical protein
MTEHTPMQAPWTDDLEALEYLKQHYPMFHRSNIFFRDIQFGIRSMLEERGKKLGYAAAETLAREFVGRLEQRRILVAVDRQTWVVHYEQYRKPMSKPVAAEKPAPAPRPAAAVPPQPAAGS